MRKKRYPPSIKVMLTEDEMDRIEKGPLRATAGRGKAAWAKVLIMEAVARAEAECRTKS